MKKLIIIAIALSIMSCAENQEAPQEAPAGIDATTDAIIDTTTDTTTDTTADIETDTTTDTTTDTATTQGAPMITMDEEPAGENCEAGGTRIDTGIDANADGLLDQDEITATQYTCNGVGGQSGESGTDGENGTDSTGDTTVVIVETEADNYVLLKSPIEKGPCEAGSAVLAFPLFDNFLQTGAHFLGETKDDFGNYEIPAQISADRTQVDFEGPCYNERYGGSGTQKLKALVETQSEHRNINPLTTIAVDIIRQESANQIEKDADQAVIDAELRVANVFGFDEMAPFSSISLNDGDLDAAKLAVASAVILQARSNQTAFMVEISEAIKNGDTEAVELELAENMAELPIITVANNLRTKYALIGHEWTYPPMHEAAGFPEYYGDLLGRVPVVEYEFNLEDNTNCQFDQNDYNTFAIPHIFESAAGIGRFIAGNFLPDAEISIWTKGVHIDGYIAPGTEVVSFIALKEIILDTPKKLSYNGFMGDDHGLTVGTEYYFRIRKDEDFTLSTTCQGDFLPFGRKLASDNEGATWIGHNNSTAWFRLSGLKLYTTN